MVFDFIFYCLILHTLYLLNIQVCYLSQKIKDFISFRYAPKVLTQNTPNYMARYMTKQIEEKL